jgi:hypothetical protein
MTPPRSPSQDVDAMMDRSAPALVADVARMERAVASGDAALIRDAQDAAAETIGRLLAFADLLGRRRMQLIATHARRTADERREMLAAETVKLSAIASDQPMLPRVEFEQAVRDIATRMPVVERDWRKVASLYSTKHAFACARAMTKAVTDRVQTIIREAIRTGESGDSFDPVSQIIEDTGWQRGYATTVYRTNAQTAYTAGIWARASDPDVMAVVPGFRFVSQHLPTSRPNHEACAGLIAPVTSHLWGKYSPPLGFSCLCAVDEVTVYEAEREGLIRNGEMLTLLPPGFGIKAHPDPGFGLGRPDRVAAFGSFT